MKLETERLILRQLTLTDSAAIQQHFPHWCVVKYLAKSVVKWPYPADGAEKFLRNIALPAMEKGDNWYWGITTRDNPEAVIGVIHLRRNPELGNRTFWLAQEHQSKGYMTEALEAVNDYAFNELGFEKLVVKNAHDNHASHRLKEKTGAELLAIVEAAEGHYIGGGGQQEIWQITKQAWQNYKTSKSADLVPFKKTALVRAKSAKSEHRVHPGVRRIHGTHAQAGMRHGLRRRLGP